MKNFLPLVLLILLGSCQDVIELDLATTSPRIVIDGYVTDQPGPYTIKISRSIDFYEPNEFPAVTGALVTISDNLGNSEVLTEESTGNYQTSTLQGVKGASYTLKVEAEGNVYVAESTMPKVAIPIDSVVSSFEEESIFYKEGYYVTAYFNDVPDQPDFGRFNIFVNGELYIFKFEDEEVEIIDDNFWMWQDKFTENNIQDFEFPHTLDQGDTIDLKFFHLEKKTYEYYRTVVEVIDGGGVAPANPVSELENQGAMGYFGAFPVTTARHIIE